MPRRVQALVQRKADLEHAKAVWKAGQLLRDVGKESFIHGVRERVLRQRWLGEYLSLDIADILIDGAIPEHAEDVAEMHLVDSVEETDVATQF